MDDRTKRELRQEKREVKRAGGKRRRRELKSGLAENPDEAPFAVPDFGKLSSAPLNGIDRRPARRDGPPEEGE